MQKKGTKAVSPLKKEKSINMLYKYISTGCAALLAGSLWLSSMFSVFAAATKEETLAIQQAKPIETNSINGWPDGPVVSADSAILMDAETGAILYAKNIHAKQYPASTTKLLTSLIATEQSSMDDIITFSNEAVFDTPRDSNHIAIDVGEELTMEQALNAILIRSANEVSFAVAEYLSGTTWEDFADIMNERAKELGCTESNFVNPNGLPDENHYTTAYDLALIGRAAFANEFLCKVSTSRLLHIPPSEKQPDDIIEYSSNELLPTRKYAYEYLVGTKTGFTIAARYSLVSCAEKDGMKLICVILRDESPYQYEDTVALFNYGFSNFDKVNISESEIEYNIDDSNFFYSDNDIFGNSKPILSLNSEASIILPKTATFSDVVSSLSYETASKNQVAIISYTYQGYFVGSASVDIASDHGASFSFDSEPLANELTDISTPSDEEENVIFINVVKVILWILGVSSAIIIIILINALINNYQFSPGDRSNRRSWRRSKRKKHSVLRTSKRHLVRNSRNRKPKRPSRFRYYDS